MQCSDRRPYGKAAGAAKRPTGVARHALLAAGLVVPAAWLLTGCSSGEDLMTTAAAPSQQTAGAARGQDTPLSPGNLDLESGALDVTPAQRGYLDALTAVGVHPSSELRALSIGSYVCQARAAGQTDQAVWDYIAPMVRSDVSEAHSSSPETASDIQVSAVTADYIRAATQRLC